MIDSCTSMYLQMISAGKTWSSSLPEWALHFDIALDTAKIHYGNMNVLGLVSAQRTSLKIFLSTYLHLSIYGNIEVRLDKPYLVNVCFVTTNSFRAAYQVSTR